MTLDVRIVARERLSAETREAMLMLHGRHFDNVQRARFFADLAEKDWVILLQEPAGALVGFSTQKLLPPLAEHGSARCLFSGDTIVERTHWNTPYLAGCFGHLMLRLLAAHAGVDLYWFLISKGYRTYRFLPVFFHQFWPRPDQETPPPIAQLLIAVATAKFGTAFDARTGRVRVTGSDHLSAALAQIEPERLHDPHVAYFVSRNPEFARGDELACLAPIRLDNLNAYAQRVIRVTHPVWEC